MGGLEPFHFSKLAISGFRGIETLEIDLPKGQPLHLIGSNNSGKSTVLQAIHLTLGGPGAAQFSPEPYDFFRSADGSAVPEFKVALHLSGDEKSLPAVQGVGSPARVHGVQLHGSTDRNGRLRHRRTLLDENGKGIAFSSKTALKGTAKTEFEGADNIGWQPRYARLDEIRKSLPEVWLLTPRNLESSLFRWEGGPLKRLAQLLAHRFLREEWTFEHAEKGRKMPDSLLAAHRFFHASVENFPFWRDELKPTLQSIFAEYVGSQTAFDLRPSVLAVEEWLSQQLSVAFAADGGGASTPLERMGDGWQSLIRLASLEALSNYADRVGQVMLLIEEPETHLHPHLQRKMRAVLQRLASKGWFVATATHGPDLVSFAEPQSIVRLWRHGANVTKGTFDTSEASGTVKLQDRLSERGNHEMLFASALVLCEGRDDTWAVRSALKRMSPDLDLDAKSISVVSTGGSGSLPDYAAIANELGIRWCAITDEDKEPAKQGTQHIRTRLENIKTESSASLIWPVNLESCLGCKEGKASPEWQAKNTDPLSLAELRSSCPAVVALCDDVISWLS